MFLGFPCGSAGKESACNVGDLGSIAGVGRSPGEGKGYPFQYSGLENCMDCIVHGVVKSQTTWGHVCSVWFSMCFRWLEPVTFLFGSDPPDTGFINMSYSSVPNMTPFLCCFNLYLMYFVVFISDVVLHLYIICPQYVFISLNLKFLHLHIEWLFADLFFRLSKEIFSL